MSTPSLKVKVSFRTCEKGNSSAPKQEAHGPSAMARRIALAHHVEDLIDRGAMDGYADAARRLGITRARVTQVCDLALLAPAIQAVILNGDVQPRDRHLREAGRHRIWAEQVRVFEEMFPEAGMTEVDYESK